MKSDKCSYTSECIHTALRMFEYEEVKKIKLLAELKKGETSGFVEEFNRHQFLEKLHEGHFAYSSDPQNKK